MQPTKPFAEGVVAGGVVARVGDAVPRVRFTWGRAESLQALKGGYAFFSPAALYVHRVDVEAPLADFAARSGATYYHARFQVRLFRGLDVGHDPAWNYVLWAVAREHWPSFYDFMLSVCLVDRDARAVRQVASRELDVVDPVALGGLRLLDRLPRLRVAALGYAGSDRSVSFTTSPSPLLHPPRATVFPPDKRQAALARRLFAGDDPSPALDER